LELLALEKGKKKKGLERNSNKRKGKMKQKMKTEDPRLTKFVLFIQSTRNPTFLSKNLGILGRKFPIS
jgi:hypothetical protein